MSPRPRLAWPAMRRVLVAGLAIALLFNLLLAAAHVWSRGGQTTVVTIEVIDGTYRVLVDGSPTPEEPDGVPARIPLEGPETGVIRLVPIMPLSSFPRPSGIDSVVVVDPAGNELFRDDFDYIDLNAWNIDSGRFRIDRGVLTPRSLTEGNSLTMKGAGWRDYTVQVTYRNNRGGSIGTHVTQDGGVFFNFELIRDFPKFFDAFKDGQRTSIGAAGWGFIHTDSLETLKSIAAMWMEPYPYLLLALGAGLLLTLVLSTIEEPLRAWASTRSLSLRHVRLLPIAIALGLAVAAFAITLILKSKYYGVVPHYPDEALYMFQAKLLATGRITTYLPAHLSDFFYVDTQKPQFLHEIGDKWASFYPFGHPLVLSVGALFGLMWMVPSLVGAACVLATYKAGRLLFDARTGIIAALLFAASPFFLMQSTNFLSHNTAALYIVLSLVFVLKRERPLLFGLLAGVFFGLAINTRPLTVISLVPPFGLLMLGYVLLQGEVRERWLRHTGAFLGGVVLLIIAWMLFNNAVTGDPLGSTQAAGASPGELYGFRDGHTLDVGIRNSQAQVSMLLVVFNAWPGFAGMILVMVPFLLGSRNGRDYFLLACAVLPMLAYMGYRYSGGFEGPRYWYETMPFLVLLSARGVETLGAFLGAGAAKLREQLQRRPVQPMFGANILVYSVLIGLVVWGSGGWLFNRSPMQDSPNMPTRAEEMQWVFGIDDRLDRLAREVELENALVLLEPCGFFQSTYCYASIFVRNNATLDGNVVWARYIAGRNQEIVEAYPGRNVYVLSYDAAWFGFESALRPYDAQRDR